MKNKFLLFLLIFNISLSYAEILSTKSVEFNEVNLYSSDIKMKETITYDEAYEDLLSYLYILETAYAGYDHMIKNSFNRNNIIDNYRLIYKNQNQIDVKDFYKFLVTNFTPFIQDGHCSLIYKNNVSNFIDKTIILFSNTYVKKYRNNVFLLYESDCNLLKVGDLYTGEIRNLFIYPSKGKNIYRVGKLYSEDKITEFDFFNFNSQDIPLKLENDGAIEKRPADRMKYHEIETDKTGYVSISSFMPADNDSIYKKGTDIVLNKYSNLAKKWKNKTNIIVDLRSNNGGYPIYSAFLFYGFSNSRLRELTNANKKNIENYFSSDFGNTLNYDSPVSANVKLQSFAAKNMPELVGTYTTQLSRQRINPSRIEYKIDMNNKESICKKNAYNGNLILIIDRNTVSAGEETIAIAKKLFGNEKQLKVIGENSYGMLSYADVYPISLPKTNICAVISFQKNEWINDFAQWGGEGIGFFPDYWSTGKDLNETIFSVTKDKQMKNKLIKIDTGLQ